MAALSMMAEHEHRRRDAPLGRLVVGAQQPGLFKHISRMKLLLRPYGFHGALSCEKS
jgi:hypothetical protein